MHQNKHKPSSRSSLGRKSDPGFAQAKANEGSLHGKHHTPVLLHEVLSTLSPKPGDAYLDLTAGYGGHAQEILALTNAPEHTTLVDRDVHAHDVLQTVFSKNVTQLHTDFESALQHLKEQGRQFNIVMGDLGVSSPHLNDASRGFSVQNDGPLDMRMDNNQSLTAGIVVNTSSKEQLMQILRDYGEEPKAARIAQAIIDNRPLHTTKELATLVAKVWKGNSKTHPATRTFQALRIEVNDELGMLKRSLPLMVDVLAPGGRIAIITFHSLEDRLVKQYFNDVSKNEYDASLKLLNKKPITAAKDELVFNPRARSAKLRGAVKIKRKG